MTQDHRPDCYYCGKKLNKKDREQIEIHNLCRKCNKKLTTTIKEAFK